MTRYEGDEDDDVPPGWIEQDFERVERFEAYKQSRPYKYGKRKAPCSCRYFKGIIPSSHICYKPLSLSKQFIRWIHQIIQPNKYHYRYY